MKVKIPKTLKFNCRVADSIASILILFLSVQLQTMEYNTTAITLETVVMVLLAVSRVFRAFDSRETRGKLLFITNLVIAAFYLIDALLISLAVTQEFRQMVTAGAITLALLSGRVMSSIVRHTVRNIVMNVFATLIILPLGFIFIIAPFWTIGLPNNVILGAVFSIWAVVHIFTIFLSRLKLDIIKNIIKKTYAVEVIFWLVLLIFAFSFVLTDIEDGIPTYLDALWYCFTLITTIGFGDFTATTFVGRILSVILGLYGIICVALITSIIVTFYGEFKDYSDEEEEALEQKHDRELREGTGAESKTGGKTKDKPGKSKETDTDETDR